MSDGEHSEAITMRKRTEITIETERFLVVSQRRRKPILWCSECDNDAPMLNLVEAARTAQTTPVAIFEMAETGKLHFVISAEGQQFICSNSLAATRVGMIPHRG
jgi:6-phosphogluconolactonase (cycloisomerase 2 family)